MGKRDNYYNELLQKINNRKAKICVMGLGYVGLPLAVAFGKKGYKIHGFDPSVSRIDKLHSGERYIVDVSPEDVLELIKQGKMIATTDETILHQSDVIIICVPTPLRKVKMPDISYVVKASRTIKKYLKPGQLIVLESTSYPTTTSEVVLPELKKTKLLEEKDFFLCFSPERVNPGDKKFPLVKIPKVVGGLSAKSTALGKSLYGKIIKKIHPVSSPEVAETSKLLENTFRLVNIALVSEFAVVCHKLGISIWEVIEAAKTKPFGFMPFYPGPGIGGHCLPCDPVYLSWKAKKLGFKTKMIDLASYMGHFMPRYVVERLKDLLKERNKQIEKSKILILGVCYKKDVKDLREAPALDIIELLKKQGAQVSYFDPLLPFIKIDGIEMQRESLTKEKISRYDCVVLVTAHSDVNYGMLKEQSQLIFDTRSYYGVKSNGNVVVL